MHQQESLVKYYHILDDNIEGDWWDYIYWEGTKDTGEWHRFDQYKFSDTYDIMDTTGYKFADSSGEIFISDISDGQINRFN